MSTALVLRPAVEIARLRPLLRLVSTGLKEAKAAPFAIENSFSSLKL